MMNSHYLPPTGEPLRKRRLGHYLSIAGLWQFAPYRVNSSSNGKGKRKTSLAINDSAAIGMEHLPSHVRAFLRGQENIAGGNFVRLSGPFHGNVLAEIGNLIGRKGGGY